ncbi:MAG: hypothetical protein U5Q44_05095 [Dehalococcoidia bacterium]|nr:hypothetical protein [Dehalococcoidia bacterium]
MADYNAKVPVEPERTHELHDQAAMPKAPEASKGTWARRFSILGIGIILAVVLTAMGVEIRAGWESHRDWVVPVIAQGAGIAGICLAYLLVRGRTDLAGPGIIALFVVLALMGANYLRGLDTEGSDALRDWFSAISGIIYGAALLSFIAGWLVAEIKAPTKPPQPEGM